MKLANMEVSGFKLYAESHSFTFGMANQILGDRGKGKTALCEAIVWCLMGCDLTGSTRGIRKRLKNWSAKEINVVTQWDFLKTNGSLVRHQFCRISKARSTHLYLDGKEVEQSDFDALFIPTDSFLSVFSPGYFGGLSAVKARNVILSMLPTIDHAIVIDRLPDEDRIKLGRFDLSDPLRCLQGLKGDLQEWIEYIEDIESRMNTIRMVDSFKPAPTLTAEENQKLDDLKSEVELLTNDVGPIIPDWLSAMEEKSKQLGSEYRELVDNWKEIKKKPLPGIDPLVEQKDRQAVLDDITTKCQTLLEQGHALRDRIAPERKNYELDQKDFLARKAHELQQLSIEIIRIESKFTVRKNNERLLEVLPRWEKQFNEGTVERDKVLTDIQSVQNFMLKYASMQVEAANNVLSLAEILLTMKREADGDIILQYKLHYNKREYFSMSSSEKIRCSFELSGLVNKIHGNLIPVFVDNGESIAEFRMWPSQFFVTTIIPQAALSYEVVVA
jgi:archaellum component FlaC